MSVISATEIKKRGIAALEPILAEEGEALVTVRGQRRYVVMTVEKYHALRELELAQAIRKTREDYRAGRFVDRTIDAHMRRLADEV